MTDEAFFDGIIRPKIQVYANLGGTLDPGPTYLHLGVGPGLGTGKLSGSGAGGDEVDITDQVRSVAISQRGPTSDIDQPDPVTCTLVLNNFGGDFDPQNPASPYVGELVDGTPIKVRWVWANVAYNRFYGEISTITHTVANDWDITAMMSATDGMEKLGLAYLPAVSPTHDNVETGTRVTFLLNEAAYPSALRAVDGGYTTLGPTTLGASALELLRKVASTEFGLFFVDGSGIATFFERHRGVTATRSTTVQATFGDPAGTIPLRDIEVSYGRGNSFNRVAITRDPAPDDPVPRPGEWSDVSPDEPVEQVADDFTIQATKGVLAFPAEVGQLLRNDSEALAEAQYLKDRYKVSQARITELNVSTLTCAANLYDDLLALGPWDRVAVDQDYGPADIADELLIQSLTEEIDAVTPAWTLTFTTSPPPPAANLWILGTTQIGTGKLGW